MVHMRKGNIQGFNSFVCNYVLSRDCIGVSYSLNSQHFTGNPAGTPEISEADQSPNIRMDYNPLRL